MEALVENIFNAAGVKQQADDGASGGTTSAMTRLEQWLDMEEAAPTTWDPLASYNGDVSIMEDCAPFSSNFYRTVGQVLVEAWNPTISSNNRDEGGLFAGVSKEEVSLFQIPVVRVTRLLRHWMELNVMGATSSAESANMTSLSQLLLKHCEGNTLRLNGDNLPAKNDIGSSSTASKSGKQHTVARVHIIKALFHHISSLPQLQHQVHTYTQSLLNTNKQEGVSTATRLEQLHASNRVLEKLTKELDMHLQHVQDILGDWYSVSNPILRSSFRIQLGRIWLTFANMSSHPPRSVGLGRMENTSACGIASTLHVLNRILMGANCPFHSSYEHLLFDILVPLHKPSGMVLWRDQTPLLDLYHVPLVQSIGTLLKQEWQWIPRVISLLLLPDIWPSSQGAGSASANTPKVVLLLHEIDTYLGLYPKPLSTQMVESFRDTIGPLTVRLGSCISSDNSRMSEQALQFFKNDNFVTMVKSNLQQTLPTLLRALCRTSDQMQLPWNPTVRKMTRLVLQELESYNEQAFAQACRSLFETERVPKHVKQSDSITKPVESPASSQETAMLKEEEKAPKQDFSLRAGMGSWKPPPSRRGHPSNRRMLPPPARPPAGSSSSGGKQPPLTVTGVAPWAVSSKPSTGSSLSSGARSTGSSLSSGAPPLTVTGVAPWATRRPPTGSGRPPKKRAEIEKGMSRSIPDALQQQPTNSLGESNGLAPLEEESEEGNSTDNPALAKVRWYMDQLKSSSPEDDDEGTSSWAKAQMAESPTLLPELKFHDLVFGHDLGTGAFGSVRYARQIVKTKTRSHWPEYAIKIVSTQKIEEMGYEQSINREIATLRVLSHPGIARLISNFRFRDGAYLVLEYASGGDLHTLLKNSGSLDQESTKFVVGSIVAALWSIHDLGFVYADLKPENILITETRHIKLTDFGGCRPVTDHAKDLIRSSGRNLLKELRDGDWKPKKPDAHNATFDEEGREEPMDVEYEEEEDLRIEGTTAYLPPEVVIGGVPTLAADSWALGCVMYQCISGRPPLLEEDDAMTRSKIVAFHMSEPHHDSRESLFINDGHDASVFSADTRELILRLLSRDPASRPNMLQTAEDKFFSGTNVFSLHKNPAPPLDVGSVAPVADARWARRQFSSIWAPQPKAYDIGISNSKNTSSWTVQNAAISEGEEGAAFFSKSHGQSSFQQIIPENVPVS